MKWRRSLAAVLIGMMAGSAPGAKRAKAASKPSQAGVSGAGFMEASSDQVQDSIDEARETAKKMPRGTAEFETDHFRVFTDWPAAERNGIRASLEGTYVAIARVFGIAPTEAVYVGKLPVYVFARQRDYDHFATGQEVKGAGETAGYFASESRYGFGRLVMFVPAGKDQHIVQETWAHVLSHEMTHSFVHRYRSNGVVPLWLNEGLAEFVAAELHPHVYADNRAIAKDVAVSGHDMVNLFDGKGKRLSYNEYAACQTVVEMLFREGREKFLGFLSAVKEGTKTEEALTNAYGCDYETLAEHWHVWIMRH